MSAVTDDMKKRGDMEIAIYEAVALIELAEKDTESASHRDFRVNMVLRLALEKLKKVTETF